MSRRGRSGLSRGDQKGAGAIDSEPSAVRPTGHLQIKGGRGRRTYYALWRDADGRHQQRLGPAHVKDSGRRTARGAVIWRSADGPKPDASHLTPDDAQDRLRAILAAAPRRRRSAPVESRMTFGEACAEWLRHVEHDKKRKPSTVRDYRNHVRADLLPAFGAETSLATIDTPQVDAFRERLLERRALSPRTAQKLCTMLHGVFERAKRKGWIAVNPAANADRVTVKRSGDFNVLSPAEVESICRAADSDLHSAIYRTAAESGLRLGELRALRWSDLDFGRRLIHVRWAYARDVRGRPKSSYVRSTPMTDAVHQVLTLLRRRGDFTAPDDLVFASPTGTPLSDRTFREGFYRALSKAGLGHYRLKEDPITFHDLRHSFGTTAVQVFPLSDVQAYMGHADIKTTMIYVHHVPREDAAERLSRAFAAA